MSELDAYRTRDLERLTGLTRPAAREIERLGSASAVDLAHIGALAELQTARADAVAFVGRRAMQDVALLSQVEQQLAEAVPHASGRLATIADLTAFALSEVVVDTARRVGR